MPLSVSAPCAMLQRSRTRWSAERVAVKTKRYLTALLQRSRTRWSAESRKAGRSKERRR